MKDTEVQFKINTKDKEELKRLADDRGLPMSAFLVYLIHNFADNPEWQRTFRLTRVKKENQKG